jgi:hypothetical protein
MNAFAWLDDLHSEDASNLDASSLCNKHIGQTLDKTMIKRVTQLS